MVVSDLSWQGSVGYELHRALTDTDLEEVDVIRANLNYLIYYIWEGLLFPLSIKTKLNIMYKICINCKKLRSYKLFFFRFLAIFIRLWRSRKSYKAGLFKLFLVYGAVFIETIGYLPAKSLVNISIHKNILEWDLMFKEEAKMTTPGHCLPDCLLSIVQSVIFTGFCCISVKLVLQWPRVWLFVLLFCKLGVCYDCVARPVAFYKDFEKELLIQ